MDFLLNDPLLQLSFSVFENKGIFAMLIGSGMSRAADIPTGWEMTLDLIRRIGLAQGVGEQANWAEWYKNQTGEDPNYSTLLEKLGSTQDERRAILHRYIEPTEIEFENGEKIPTKAHKAIAELVRKKYIRVIITTNFDRLLENALRECGVEPTVISSVDALKGAEPIAHSACYILKIHGDYKDARILNTDAELNTYPDEYDRLLDRIFDEYGLIVTGWSGEWDHALRRAFLRVPNRRYPLFWATRGTVGSGAEQILQHRAGRKITVSDADTFLSTLLQRVETLEQSRQANPVSVELLVNNTKRFLSKPEYRIQLDDLMGQEADRVIESLKNPEFSTTAQPGQIEFRSRVSKLEMISESVACMAGVLGRWGDGAELSLILDVIRSLLAAAETQKSGQVSYINLRSYPANLVFTAYALALTRAERFATLLILFNTPIQQGYSEPSRAVETLFIHTWPGAHGKAFNLIENLDTHKTPFSDHLALLFSNWGKRFLGLTSNFDLLFERFEILGACAHMQQTPKLSLQSTLDGEASGRNFVWLPLGRVSWDSENSTKLIAELKLEPLKSKILDAGFAQGDPEYLEAFFQNFMNVSESMRWT